MDPGTRRQEPSAGGPSCWASARLPPPPGGCSRWSWTCGSDSNRRRRAATSGLADRRGPPRAAEAEGVMGASLWRGAPAGPKVGSTCLGGPLLRGAAVVGRIQTGATLVAQSGARPQDLTGHRQAVGALQATNGVTPGRVVNRPACTGPMGPRCWRRRVASPARIKRHVSKRQVPPDASAARAPTCQRAPGRGPGGQVHATVGAAPCWELPRRPPPGPPQRSAGSKRPG